MKTQVRPKSGIITVAVQTQDGQRIISTGTTDKAEAREIIRAANIEGIEAIAKTGQLTAELIRKLTSSGNITLEQAITQWAELTRSIAQSDRTADNSIMYVNAWARGDAKRHSLLKKRLSEITPEHISKWVNAEDGAKLGSRTVRLAAVRSLFKFCVIRQYITWNPTLDVGVQSKLLTHEQKETKKKTCFTDEEIGKITTYLSELLMKLTADVDQKKPNVALNLRINNTRFWYCAVIIGRYSGLRLGDICSLEWASLNKPGKLIVHTDKKDTRVEIPVDDNLFKGISAIPTNNLRMCFPEQDAAARNPAKRSKLSVQFGRILDAVGIEGHSFHDLRHSFLTALMESGKTLEQAAEAAGHTSTKSTKVYIHERDTDTREAGDSLNG